MPNLPRQDDSLLPSSKDNNQDLTSQPHTPRSGASTSSESIKAVAIYEVVKGVGALLGAGALWSWHSDLEHWLTTATAS